MSSWYNLQQERLQKPSPKAINDDKDNADEQGRGGGGGGGGGGGEASSSWSPQSSFLRRRSNSNSSSAKNRRQRIKGKKSKLDDGTPSEFDLLDDEDTMMNEKVLTEEELKKKRERLEQKKSWRERSAQKKREREAKWKDLKLAKRKQKKEEEEDDEEEDEDEDEGDAFCVEDTDDVNDKNKDNRKAKDADDDDDTDGTDGSENVDVDDDSKENKDDDDDDDDSKKNKEKNKKKKDKYEVDILKLAPGEEPKAPTCCRRYLSERNPCYEWYQIKDKLSGKRLDVQATFCPTSRRARFFKFLAASSIVAGNVMNMMAYRDSYGTLDLGFFVYADNVGMVASLAYMMLSMLNSILGARQPWDVVEGRMRWVWLAFIVASHTQVMMSIMYWSLVYPGLGDDVGEDADGTTATSNAKNNAYNLSFLSCMKYGGIAITVILDGMKVNRIPLRWMNWWGMLWFLNLFYVFFFAPLYCFFFCSDLAVPGASTALYPWLDWKGDWEFTLIVGVVFVFALSPAVFLILWLMSLYTWPSCFCCRKESHRFLMSHAQRRKIKEAKLDAYNKKKEKQAQDNEELAFLQSDPKKLLPNTDKGESGMSTEKNNTISSLFNRNRRSRQDNDDETVMSAGSQSMTFQPGEDSRDRQADDGADDLESQNDTAQQRQEFSDDGTVASNGTEQEPEQAQPAAATRAGWGRLGGLRTFLGSSMNNRNSKTRNNTNNFDSSNDADSSISSMTESQYGYRSAIANGDDQYVEDVPLDEAKYPWDDAMGGLASDKKKTTTAAKDRSSPVVDNLNLLDDADDSSNNDNDLPDKQYKYPWDRDGSQGSLTYL